MVKLRLAAVLAVCAITLAARPTPAGQVSPMEQMARDLGTPKIGYTAANDAHTRTMFEWVPKGETVNNWTKMFTVIATSVDRARTAEQTRAQIVSYRKQLTKSNAKVSAYDVRDQSPPVAYFSYVVGGEINVGVVFSPTPGIVTIQQVAAHRAGVITGEDIRRFKRLVGYPG